MKAIRMNKPNLLEVVEIDEPEIKASNDVKIKVKSGGICGSDVGIYTGNNPMATYPRILGHEMAGEVVEVGTEVSSVKVGDHVAVDPVNNCGICPACRKGRPNICYELEVSGVHRDGFFSEYFVSPEKNVYKLDKNIPWEQAFLVEPFSIGAESTATAQITPADTVLILGAGNIGQTSSRYAVAMGAKVIVASRNEDKLKVAKEHGVSVVINTSNEDLAQVLKEHTDGMGPDVIIDTICVPETVEQAVELAAPAGRIVTLGFTETPSKIQQKWITSKELKICGSRLNNRRFPQVIQNIEDGKISLDGITSDIYYFEDVQDAMDKILDRSRPTKKVVLKFYE